MDKLDRIIQEETNIYLNETLSNRWANAKSGFNMGRQMQRNGAKYTYDTYIRYIEHLEECLDVLEEYSNYFEGNEITEEILISIIDDINDLYKNLKTLIDKYSKLNATYGLSEGLGNRLKGMFHGFRHGNYQTGNYDVSNEKTESFNELIKIPYNICDLLLEDIDDFNKKYKNYPSAKKLIGVLENLKQTTQYIQNLLSRLFIKKEKDLRPAYNNAKQKIQDKYNQGKTYTKNKYNDFVQDQKEKMAHERAVEQRWNRIYNRNGNQDDNIKGSERVGRQFDKWNKRLSNSKFGRFIDDIVNGEE